MAVVDEIRLSGFGSYGPEQTLTLGGQGPVAIIGDNGAGKSTVISKGLTWCLYGKCPPERMGSGTRAIAGRAVVGTGQKKAVVSVTINDQGVLWRITRERARTGSDVVTVYRDSIEQPDATQIMIDGIVGADYETFCRTVVRGQGDPWSFAEATDGRKREILDAISGAAELETTLAVAKQKRVEAMAAAKDAKNSVGWAVDHLARIDPEATQRQLTRWEADQALKVKDAKSDLEALKVASLKAAVADKKIGDNQKKRTALAASKPELDRDPYRKAIATAGRFYREAFAEHQTAAKDVDRLSALGVGDPCPTCEQPIGPIVVTKLVEARGQAKTKKQAAEKAEEEEKRCDGVLCAAEKWLSDEFAQWETDRDAIPNLAPQGPAIDREISQAKRRLTDLAAVVNPYQARLEGEVKSAGSLRRELKIAQAVERQAQWVVDAASAWEEALGPRGARAHMAEAALAAIETAANRWLAVLSERGLMVEFPPTREVKGRTKEEIKTVVHIDDNGKQTVRDLLTFSGGERRRINLAVDLGVAAACGGGGLSLSLLVLDEEVFSGMDDEGKAAVVSALHSAGVADVVIIDHDPRLSSTLSRTIKVTRSRTGHSQLSEVST